MFGEGTRHSAEWMRVLWLEPVGSGVRRQGHVSRGGRDVKKEEKRALGLVGKDVRDGSRSSHPISL